MPPDDPTIALDGDNGNQQAWIRIFDKDDGFRDYNPALNVPDLAVVTTGSSSINLTWQDIEPDATVYRIQRSTDGENFSIYKDIARSDLNFSDGLISWTDTGLDDGQQYWYRVRAVDSTGAGNDSGYSPKKDTVTVMTTPDNVHAVANPDGTVTVTWADESLHEDSFTVQAWAGDDQTSLSIPANQTSATFHDLTLGTQYHFNVMAYNDQTNSDMSDDVAATPSIAPPTDVMATNLNNATHDIEVDWQPGTAYDSVIVRKYSDVNGIFGTDPIDEETVDGTDTSFTFAGNDLGASYGSTVQGELAASSSDDDAGGMHMMMSTGGPLSQETPPVENFDDPSSTWTNDVYESAASGVPNVTAIWSPLLPGGDDMGNPTSYFGGYTDQTVTLVLAGLSRHTWGKISGWIDAEGPPPGDDSWEHINFAVSIDGQTMHSKMDDFDGEPSSISTEYGVSVGDGSADAPDAFRHKAKSMTVTISATGLPDGWMWSPSQLFVDTYLPFVSIDGSGTVIEDNTGKATFTVHRTGDGTVLSDPLIVSVVDAGGGVTNSATGGTDYQLLNSITIPAKANDGSKDVVPINDDAAEDVEDIYQSVTAKPIYALAAPAARPPATGPTTAEAHIDDDIVVRSITEVRVPWTAVPQNAGQQPPVQGANDPEPGSAGVDFNRYYGYDFAVKITITGEHLDKVFVRQEVLSRTEYIDPVTGQLHGPDDANNGDAVLQMVRNADQNAPSEMVNNQEPNVLDPGSWNWDPLGVKLGTHDGIAEQYDHQSFVLPTAPVPNMQNARIAPVFMRTMRYKLRFSNTQNPFHSEDIAQSSWGYYWTNDVCEWTAAEGAPDAVDAASFKNGGKGRLDSPEVGGLDALN